MMMADLWIATPLLLLATGAIVVLLLGALRHERAAGLVALLVLLAAAAWILLPPPALEAPTLGLAATPLARFFSLLFCLASTAVLLLARNDAIRRGISGEEYPATLLFTTFGMLALSGATNLLILFLGLEAMTFGFYILVAIDLKQGSTSEAGLKYLVLGALAAAFLAFGIALLYAGTGTLALERVLPLSHANRIAQLGWGFLLIGAAFKLSLVPAHLWTPDIYQAIPAPVAALLSTASKAAALLALLLILPYGDATLLHRPLQALALLSMLLGNLAALLQGNIRRMLAYSSIAQMGYVVLALLCGPQGGYSAAAFYAAAYLLMGLATFGALTLMEQGGCSTELASYRGQGFAQPLPAAILGLGLFALAGIPPTAGFTGKFLIFSAAIKANEIPLAVLGILSAAVSAYYYLRVVVVLYMHPAEGTASTKPSSGEITVLLLVACLLLLAGLWPTPLLQQLALTFPLR